MGDYVVESNPALERLIERHRAQGNPQPRKERSNSNGDAKRSRWRRRSKVHTADPAKCATVADPEVFEDDLWVIPEDPRSDELVLVGFDEEPEVFDEDPEDLDEDQDEADEADEVLDVYEGEEPSSESETADVGEEVFEEDVVLDQDDEEDVDDEVPVEVVGAFEDEGPRDEQSADGYRGIVDEDAEVIDENQREGGDRMLDAFDDTRLERGDEDAVQHEEDLEALDEDEGDEFSEMFDEDTNDLVQAPEPAYEQQHEVPVALLELPGAHNEPYDSALSALSSQLIVNSGRKKARHKKQSPRQRKRSLRKAEQDARKAEKS
jgi:hypothetical protein